MQKLPYTVFLNTGAQDIFPVLVVAENEESAFIMSLQVFKRMFPTYSGYIRGISTTMGWAIAANLNNNVH